MKNFFRPTLVFFLFLFPLSCDRDMVYDEFIHLENGNWEWDNPAAFTFAIEDTVGTHNILVRVRHTTDYPLSNFYMFVDLKGPSGQELKDTINLVLAEKDGKWKGSGVGNIRELGYLFRSSIRFPQAGDYQVSLEQAMRLPSVPVSEVGIRVEKSQK